MTQTFYQTRVRALAALAVLLPTASMLARLKPPHGDDDDDDEPGRGIEALLAKADKAETVARTLYQENYQLRDQRRKLKGELTELKAKQPADGTVMLTKEDAAEWEALKALGKSADVKKQLDDGKAAAEAVSTRERGDRVGAAAKDVGYNPEVLTQLMGIQAGNELVTRTVDLNGQKVNAHYVKNAQGTEVELGLFAQQNWAAFMPSLQAAAPQGGGQGQGQGGAIPPNGQPAAQPWLGGGAGAGQGAGPAGGADLTKTVETLLTGRGQQPNALERAVRGTGGSLPGGPGAPPPAGGQQGAAPAGTGTA